MDSCVATPVAPTVESGGPNSRVAVINSPLSLRERVGVRGNAVGEALHVRHTLATLNLIEKSLYWK